MAHVSDKKKRTVLEFAQLLEKYPVIGVVNMANLPAKQVQGMRAKMREGNAVLRMTKKRLLKQAFAQCKKPGIAELEKYMVGMPALIFTEENPFKLYSELQKTKSKAPAKPGQKSPKDIVVAAGPTSFTPGPVISQLAKYGIKTGVESGKLVIKQDCVVAEKGDEISADLAGILARLGIEPMEIGLDMTAAYENGTIYTADVLFVDEGEYKKKISTAYLDSFNLAVYIAYPSHDTMGTLLGKAHREAMAVALESGVMTSETVKDIIAKVYLETSLLSGMLNLETYPAKEGE